MSWFFRTVEHTPLGRWCHPKSPVYAKICNQALKAQMNMDDHTLCTGKTLLQTREQTKQREVEDEEREQMMIRLFDNGTL